MKTNCRLSLYGFVAGVLTAGLLLALPAVCQSKQAAAARKDSGAKSDSSAAYMTGCCSTNEELQQFYLGLPEAKKPTPRAPDGHPDLTGFYDNPFNTTVTKSADGSVSFTLGGGRRINTYKWPTPAMPSYKPEYAAKVEGFSKINTAPARLTILNTIASPWVFREPLWFLCSSCRRLKWL